MDRILSLGLSYFTPYRIAITVLVILLCISSNLLFSTTHVFSDACYFIADGVYFTITENQVIMAIATCEIVGITTFLFTQMINTTLE